MSFWGIYSFFYNFALKEWFPYWALLDDLINCAEIKAGENILDAGCGNGFLIRKIIKENSKKEIKVIGVDSNQTMLAFARRNCKGLPNVKFKISDLNQKLPFSNSSFDKIICCNTLYALENPERTISEFYRILKPGGLLIIANPKPSAEGKELFKEQIRILRKLSPFSKKLYHFFLFSLLMPINLVIMIMNKLILEKAKEKKYHFLEDRELKAIYQKVGFKNIKITSSYANQNWLIKGTK